ncbi:MAG: 4Fe-4S dicluster domain-containing protein [bacterium]|nr:4Fe-4S dicluster domain-containing protein [bacterium]
MKINRREFLKMAGASTLLGIGGGSIFELLAPGKVEASSKEKPAGRRAAMVIDMSKFDADEYKRCIEACHTTHNVPQIPDPKHEVKWLWTENFENAFPGHADEYMAERLAGNPFLVLCNHCQNPPCVRVCPTKATFKRKDGIVAMDYHRCIGCRFCMAACPFGARSFNWNDPRPFIKELNKEFPTRTKGVVEKCNFCVERLSNGDLPACVEASNGALIFGDLGDSSSEVRKALRENYAIRRKSELGTYPSVYYIIGR